MNVLKADDFKKLVEDLVRMGKDAGADEVEAALQQGSEFSVDVRLGEIENMIEAGSCHVSIKIIADKKTALTTSSDLDRSTLEALIKNAVQRAALGSPDEYAGLPPASETSAAPDNLELYDPSISQLDSEKKIALARNTERIAMADKRIINSHGAGFETREIRTILANSHGFSEEFSETYCSLGLGLQALVGAQLAQAGSSMEEIVARLTDIRERTRIVLVLDTLENLRRGGRANLLVAAVERMAKVLDIKPVINLVDGELRLMGAARSFGRGLRRLRKWVESLGPVEYLAVVHTRQWEMAEELANRLAQITDLPRERIWVRETGPALASHGGPGIVGVMAVPVE